MTREASPPVPPPVSQLVEYGFKLLYYYTTILRYHYTTARDQHSRWLKEAPTLSEDTAPRPTAASLEAWGAPAHSRARPWQAGEPRAAPASPPCPDPSSTCRPTLLLTRWPSQHGHFPIKHGHFLIKHGRFPIIHGRFPHTHGRFPISHGRFQPGGGGALSRRLAQSPHAGWRQAGGRGGRARAVGRVALWAAVAHRSAPSWFKMAPTLYHGTSPLPTTACLETLRPSPRAQLGA